MSDVDEKMAAENDLAFYGVEKTPISHAAKFQISSGLSNSNYSYLHDYVTRWFFYDLDCRTELSDFPNPLTQSIWIR